MQRNSAGGCVIEQRKGAGPTPASPGNASVSMAKIANLRRADFLIAFAAVLSVWIIAAAQ